MRIKLHHVNFCTTNVPAMDAFYRDVLGLEAEPSLAASRVTTEGYAGEVAFVTDGQMQLHLAERDLTAGFRTGKANNPLERGHVAFQTADNATLKQHLRWPLNGVTSHQALWGTNIFLEVTRGRHQCPATNNCNWDRAPVW